jgi:hypothetical protein
MKNNIEIDYQKYYDKYILNKKIYRVFSSEYEEDILKYGLEPKRNPYKKVYRKIKKLFKILEWLEKYENFNHTQNWGSEKNAEHIIRVTLDDMNKGYIDFTPNHCEVNYYKKYMANKGGAIVSCVHSITDDILKRKPKLPWYTSYRFINKMDSWCKDRGLHQIKVIELKLSYPFWEKAFFQTKLGEISNLPCPYGTYEHFIRCIEKYGLDKYKLYLESNFNLTPKDKAWFNLRMTSRIDSKYIKVI